MGAVDDPAGPSHRKDVAPNRSDEELGGKRTVLLRLTSLRAFAALGVFAYHLGHDRTIADDRLIGFGYTGVGFFFVLSGFVLAWSTPASMAPWTFLRNRFARIYPATFVTIVTALLVPTTALPLTIGGVILSFFLLQAWVPSPEIAFAGNAVVWSLSCEAAFYLAFPFVVVGLRKLDNRSRLIVACTYFLLASAFVAFVSLHAKSVALISIAFTNPVVRFGEFLLGMAAALAIKDGKRMKMGVTLGLCCVSLILLGATRASPLPDSLLAPLFLAVIVLAAQRDLQRPHGLLASRWFVYAGEVSFCFYLVHELVIINVLHVVGHGGSEVVIISFGLACLAAIALHHLVELPCQAWIRGKRSAAASIATHPEGVGSVDAEVPMRRGQ